MAARIGVLGAGGRMGQTIIDQIGQIDGAILAGAAEKAGHPAMGQAIGNDLVICANTLALAHSADVLVDFTIPDALAENLEAACTANTALIIGTTGLDDRHHAAIDEAAKTIPILQTANTSLGVTMLSALVRQAARRLGDDWDIEIVEMHHRHKVDAPSGTALMLGAAAAGGRGTSLADVAKHGRAGTKLERQRGEIGFAALRGGSVAGDHMVVLAADGERLELGHRAESRAIFAAGAVKAAIWIVGQQPGRYGMEDVLGL